MSEENRPKYVVANSYKFDLLAVQVNTYMDIGYVPVGGIHVNENDPEYEDTFYQAMVLRDPVYIYDPGELVRVK